MKELTFGKYKGKDLKWIVLDENDDKLLIITKDIVRIMTILLKRSLGYAKS